jgi:hypothetical protein
VKIEDAKDSELVGIQRRFDDESKRRLVKRTVNKFLKGVSTVILAKNNDFESVCFSPPTLLHKLNFIIQIFHFLECQNCD